MAIRTYNTRLLKATLTYSVQDIAELYGAHKNVIRRWFNEGLHRIDDQKPYLVRGSELRRFLDARQSGRKAKCQPNEFYCFKCRAPRLLLHNKVSIPQDSEKFIVLQGCCCVCGKDMHKIQAKKMLPEIEKIFDVERTAGINLLHSIDTHLNVDMEKQDDISQN